MNLVSEIAEHWFGLCRKPPAVHALQTDIGIPMGSAFEGLPDGGGGGSGTIRRGIGAALSGTKTLAQNRQLLWFTILAGLVLAGNAIGQAALRYIDRAAQPGGIVELVRDFYILDFFLEFITVFCLLLLLAGLVLSLSSKKGGPASFSKGLAGAKKYWKPIFLWSLVLALAGILLFRIWCYVFFGLPPEFRFLNNFGPYFFDSTITQFPFNWTLDWAMLTELPGYGGRSLLLLIYPFGLVEAMNVLVINLLLFVLTPFVVPLTVFEQKTLREAVAGSFAMMKKTWGEIAACAAFLGIVVFGVFLMYLLVQAVSGMVSPYETVMFHPTVTWIALALLYNLALVTFAFVVATVGGIAALHLYTSAKSRQMPGSPEPEPHA
ncbi:MAG: DUF6159 family protein [Methanoregula sp.]|jgi:hypothetical protein|uniref:DUF6159 family protein n=1 Tax=Methanoregula sp. TaxID=2052170 RepID=UPI0025DB97B8|nr:DUF6159 family protein [Methanoregula sp.]MCK9630734.1 DUF6159 family protein [Methanoregula sp.]